MPARPPRTHPGTINAYAGVALVFGSSAAVLVIELVALRLLARASGSRWRRAPSSSGPP